MKLAVRAFSLPEVLVYAAMIGILSMLLGPQLVRVWRLSYRLQLRDDAHKMLNIALSRLLLDLRNTRAEGVSLRSSPLILAINRIDSVQGDGLLLWQKEYHLYYLDQDRLLRRRWPDGPPSATSEEIDPTRPKLLSPDRLLLIHDAVPTGRVETLASRVLSFRMLPDQREGGLALPLQIELRAGAVNSPQDQIVVRRSVTLR